LASGSNAVRTILVFATALAFVAPAIPAAAASAEEATAVRVIYSDLDLNSPGDAAVMLQRLRLAALRSCGASQFSIPDYRRSIERSACYRESMDRAVSQLGNPTISRLYGAAAPAGID
jgi:UrcA family protein